MTATRALAPYNARLRALLASLPRASSLAKALALLVLLINAENLPFVWHYRVLFLPIFSIRLRGFLHRLSILRLPRHVRLQKRFEWYQGLCPVGKDPIAFEVVEKGWASPALCDFNLHLSNSSYPRMLDAARFKAALKISPTFFRAGGWMPLAATHFWFIKEIPIFARYEMRMRIVAWDDKWLYVVVRFVSPPSSSSSSSSSKRAKGTQEQEQEDLPPSGEHAPLLPQLHTPGSALVSPYVSRRGSFVRDGSGNGKGLGLTAINGAATSTPTTNSATNGTTNTNANTNVQAEKTKTLRDLGIPTPEPDGATLHCVSVSVLCYKMGRITVPPAVVLASEGFSRVPPSSSSSSTSSSPTFSTEETKTETEDTEKEKEKGEKEKAKEEREKERYTHSNPPPSFLRSLALQQPDFFMSERGHLRTFQRFLRGGWRDISDGFVASSNGEAPDQLANANGEAGHVASDQPLTANGGERREGGGERWWEDALGGEVEVRRRANLERVKGVREGVEGAGSVLW